MVYDERCNDERCIEQPRTKEDDRKPKAPLYKKVFLRKHTIHITQMAEKQKKSLRLRSRRLRMKNQPGLEDHRVRRR